MIAIGLIVTLIALAHAQTRYVIGDYTVITDTGTVRYPIDICLNYQVEFSGASYGRYTCNAAGDVVIFTDYGADSTCRTIVSTEEITDTTLFNCDGTDNYVVRQSCLASAADPTPTLGDDGGDACCQGPPEGLTPGCLYTHVATEICFPSPNGDGTYHMSSCESWGGNAYIYADDACTNQIGVIDAVSSTIDYCGYLTTQLGLFDVYWRMRTCVKNGVQVSTDTYCDEFGISWDPTPSPTPSPTPVPTADTEEPSPAPTPMPTADTAEPSPAPTPMPTDSPTTAEPTPTPTKGPTMEPTDITEAPTMDGVGQSVGHRATISFFMLLTIIMVVFVL